MAKILAVDDEPAILEMIESILNKDGHLAVSYTHLDFFVHPEYFNGFLDGSRARSRCVRCGYCNPDCTGNFRSVFVFDFLCTDAAI